MSATSLGLVGALQRVFRPLARLLIARSVPFPLASGLLRRAYVEVADDEFPVAGKSQTDSRITLLTGVHRKDVKRLRGERHPDAPPPRAVSLGSQLIARWMSLPAYVDAAGQPKPLPRVAERRGVRSFETLVRELNTDIRPRVVLDEWQRLGIVHVDAHDHVHLEVQGFVPAEGSEELMYFFGRNLHDHAATAVSNLLGGQPPRLERGVNYNHLSDAAVAELTALAQDRGTELLRELNARALELQQRDLGQPGASNRINVGVYLFTDGVPPKGDADEQ